MSLTLTEEHIEIAWELAARFSRSWPYEDIDDLREDALWGLYKAWKHYDPVKGEFDVFARVCIWQSLRWHTRARWVGRPRTVELLDTMDTGLSPSAEDEAMALFLLRELVMPVEPAPPVRVTKRLCGYCLGRFPEMELGLHKMTCERRPASTTR